MENKNSQKPGQAPQDKTRRKLVLGAIASGPVAMSASFKARAGWNSSSSGGGGSLGPCYDSGGYGSSSSWGWGSSSSGGGCTS